MKRNSKIRRSAFTLIEVVVVIVILVMLASIATPLYMNHVAKAKVSTAKAQINLFDGALTDYQLDVGSYPEKLEYLVKNLDDNEKWKGPYLKPAAIPKDPWDNEYIYNLTDDGGTKYEIISYGADGKAGGTGNDADISNRDGEEDKE